MDEQTRLQSHLCQDAYRGLPGGMRELYDRLGMIPTSPNADAVLIRSYVAYWQSNAVAERAVIKSSRGHSYRLTLRGQDYIVRIADHYDHREGVTGWR